MRVPRLRFTLRRMMVAVAIVGVLLGIGVGVWRRHVSFKRWAVDYAARSNEEMMKGMWISSQWFRSELDARIQEEHYRLMDYYEELKAKYERAAARPWLPVESDRPPPGWPEGLPRVDDMIRPQPGR